MRSTRRSPLSISRGTDPAGGRAMSAMIPIIAAGPEVGALLQFGGFR